MAYLIHDIYEWYRDLIDNRSDPRVKDWPMMSSPFPTLALCIFYAYFSKSLAPKIMENRKPMDLRTVLVYYNLFQTVFSTWIFYEYLMSGWWGHYSFKCQPVDYSNSPLAMRMASTCWWYYISKFTEFFDTLFFLLRKKNEHVSTLHVIHHGCMPFSVWMGMRFAPGGHSTFFALLNSFVHIVMYFYYMIAAMGPKYQKYIWWKKYLTTFQMVQFVAIFSHQLQLLFRDCDYPKGFVVWISFHGIMFLFLFSDFYKTKYTNKDKKKKDDEKKLLTNGHTQNGRTNGLTNGHTNGYANGHATVTNNNQPNKYLKAIRRTGHILSKIQLPCMLLDEEDVCQDNGDISISKTNGHANGHANGHTTNGHILNNGGSYENVHHLNGLTNGYSNGTNNELHHRSIK